MAYRILIVEDNETVALSLRDMLLNEGFDADTALDPQSGLAKALTGDFDVVVTDLQMPGENDSSRTQGLDLVRELRRERPHLPVIVMTAYHTTQSAILATQLGAFDYVLKPIEPSEFMQLLRTAAENKQAATEPVSFGARTDAKSAIVGNSRLMQEVYKEIGRVAARPVTVLIRGETGTGKELVARALYHHGDREKQPFIVVNCAALPDNLLESELFGHEPGAFTGARLRRIGRFEQAHTGTIFLDEIGDLGPHTQVKLLRVLQERYIQRLGGKEDVLVDVRILAATHRDLETAVRAGKFRSDLYFRIQEAVITLPPLRERLEDIPDLAKYILERGAAQLQVRCPPIDTSALEFLAAQAWPGNVRQLRAVLRKALLSTQGRSITAAQLEEALLSTRGHPETAAEKATLLGANEEFDSEQPFSRRAAELLSLAKQEKAEKIEAVLRQETERELYTQAMRLAAGNQTQVARWLGVSRPTVREKLQILGIASNPRSGPAASEVRVLLVATDPSRAEELGVWLEHQGYQAERADSLEAALTQADYRRFDLVLSDLELGADSGLDLVTALQKRAARLPVILMVAPHSTDIAIEAIKRGAYDYLVRPGPDGWLSAEAKNAWFTMLTGLLEHAVRSKHATEAVVLPADTPVWEEQRDRMLGRSRGMRDVYKEIGRLATTPVTVLIRGETGTGKELVARAFYQHGDRLGQPFIVVNCAAIPETLLESELFGHEAGAFTDAKTRRIGRFEQANHGTIFLDEIGDLSPNTQAKLLRVLQEKTVQRLGGSDTLHLDVRVLAATHRDLESAIKAGAFRSDLYFRFGEAVIQLPPLRERREDIEELAKYFVQRDGAELGWPNSVMTAEGLEYLRTQAWPGNVRELRNVVRRAVLLARDYAITAEDLEKALHPIQTQQGGPNLSLQKYVRTLLAKAQRGELAGIESMLLEALERELYRQAISASDGDQTRASRWLGVSRPTVREKLAKYGLLPDKENGR